MVCCLLAAGVLWGLTWWSVLRTSFRGEIYDVEFHSRGPAGQISLELTNGEGEPLPGVGLRVWCVSDYGPFGQTDRRGRLTLPGNPSVQHLDIGTDSFDFDRGLRGVLGAFPKPYPRGLHIVAVAR